MSGKTCTVLDCEEKHFSSGFCHKHYDRFKRYGDPIFCKVKYTPRGTISAWLQAHVDYDGEGCLIWPFTRGKDGRASGIIQPARTMCRLAHGEPGDPKMEAAHSCGQANAGCIHPKHLRWATHKENEDDKLLHGTRLFGSKHQNSKLSEGDVQIIRTLLKRGHRHRAIAAKFGVARGTITNISIRATWSQVP